MRCAVFFAMALATAPALGAPGDEICKRDLFMADAGVTGSLRAMEFGGSKPEEQCAAWQRHLDALRKASAAYGRCAEGATKARKVAELNGSAADFQRLIGERCRGGDKHPMPRRAKPYGRAKPGP
jgi:hypothetical protein